MDPLAIFQARQAQCQATMQAIQRRLDQIAFLRFLVFAAGAVLQVASWAWGGAWWLLCLFLGILAFGITVRWNLRVRKRLHFQELLLQFNREEERRLQGDLAGFDQGEEFIDLAHPYTSDLDVFGPHSMFQLISRASTVFGRQALARWMRTLATSKTVRERQEAARELAMMIDWRQSLQALGTLQAMEGESPERLRQWMQEPGFVAQRPWLRLLPWIMIPTLVVVVGLEAMAVLPFGWFVAVLGFNFVVNRIINGRVERIQAASKQRGRLLEAWSGMLAQVEGVKVQAHAMRQLQARLSTQGRSASQEIARLGRIVGNLEFRDSGFPHFVLNTAFYWDVGCMIALERWKQRLGERLLDWFEVIGEVEALGSLAAMRFAFPGWADAQVIDGGFLLEGEDLGHPLIPRQQRVTNPVSLLGNGTVWLVTGSNMSGKSTYLRTVGLNAMLALLGAPVCARSLRLSPLHIATSMRTVDSLEENTSSFYAELKRLQAVLQGVKTHPNALFLLDEILKGTNSRDRQAGARALVLQLHQLGGSGLVSTHDIELVDLASHLPAAIHNYSFNCTVSPDGKLTFDYTLTPGQCLSMNATALMRAMGIDV